MEGADTDSDSDAEWEAAAMERVMERAVARLRRMALLEEDEVGLWDCGVSTRGA